MTGLRERPNTQPPEKRKAESRERSPRRVNTYQAERASILLLYASKIAAAQLYARKDELAAIIAVLRAEERAALNALRDKERAEHSRRRNPLTWQFRIAARATLWRLPKSALRSFGRKNFFRPAGPLQK